MEVLITKIFFEHVLIYEYSKLSYSDIIKQIITYINIPNSIYCNEFYSL